MIKIAFPDNWIRYLLLLFLCEQEIDGLTSGMIATPERKRVMNFAYIFWAEPHTMVVPRPGKEPRLFAFIEPFQSNVAIFIHCYISNAEAAL